MQDLVDLAIDRMALIQRRCDEKVAEIANLHRTQNRLRREDAAEQIARLRKQHRRLNRAAQEISIRMLDDLRLSAGPGKPNLSEALDAYREWPGTRSGHRETIRSLGLVLTGRVTSRRQRVIALDLRQDDDAGLRRTLAGMRALVGVYYPPLRSRHLQFAIIDHTDSDLEPELRTLADLSEPVLFAGSEIVPFTSLEYALKHIQAEYGVRSPRRAANPDRDDFEAEPSVAIPF